MKWYEEWYLIINLMLILVVIGYLLVTHHKDIKEIKHQVSQLVR